VENLHSRSLKFRRVEARARYRIDIRWHSQKGPENMPLFLCRWPNGDCSVVLARTKGDAIIELDQVGNAEGCPITQVRTFQIQFALTDRGDVALERFGEGTKEDVISFAYPLLERALDAAYRGDGYENYEDLPPNRRAAIARAVEQERRPPDLEGDGGDRATDRPRPQCQESNRHADDPHRPAGS